MEDAKVENGKPEGFTITITGSPDGQLSWNISTKDMIEQQFLDILRVIEDEIIVNRAVRSMKTPAYNRETKRSFKQKVLGN